LINWGEIEGRFNPSYYTKDILDIFEKIKANGITRLLNICDKIKNGSTPKGGEFEESGIVYYRSQDFDLYQMNQGTYITEEFNQAIKRSYCRQNDILLAVVGATLGKIGYIQHFHQEGNINQNVARIRIVSNDYLPEFIAIYLYSTMGQTFIKRYATITAQPYLNNEQINRIPIPMLHKDCQQHIIDVVKAAYEQKHQKEQQAKDLLNSINSYLLHELGIVMPQEDENALENRMFFTGSNQVLGGRFDPRKYTNRYQKIFAAIENSPFEKKCLWEIILDDISGNWGLDETETGSELVHCLTIRATEFDNKFNLNLENNRTKYRKYKQQTYEKIALNPNEILVEKSGGSDEQPVGRVAFIEKDMVENNTLAYSNFIHKLILNELDVYPRYVFEYLRLMHNIKATEVMQTQTNGIRNLIMREYFGQAIVLPDKDMQKRIADKVSKIRIHAKKLEMDADNTIKEARAQVEKILLKGSL